MQLEIEVTRLKSTNPEEYNRKKEEKRQAEQMRLIQSAQQNQMQKAAQTNVMPANAVTATQSSVTFSPPGLDLGGLPIFAPTQPVMASVSTPADATTQMVDSMIAPTPTAVMPQNHPLSPQGPSFLSRLSGVQTLWRGSQ